MSPEKVKYSSVICMTNTLFWLCFFFDLSIFQTSWSVNLAPPRMEDGSALRSSQRTEDHADQNDICCWNRGYRPPIRTNGIVELLYNDFRFWKYQRRPPPTGSTDRPKGLELKFCIFVIFTVSQPLLMLFIEIVFEIVFIWNFHSQSTFVNAFSVLL